MLKITLKICAALLCTSALASQAFAEDLASAGYYGNYLKPGCFWTTLGGAGYPMSGSGGQQVGTVIVNYIGLICPPDSSGTSAGPHAMKVNVTYDFAPGYGTDSSSCSIYPQGTTSTATVVGTSCDNYKVSRP